MYYKLSGKCVCVCRDFIERIGVHQCSALSTYLFPLVKVTKDISWRCIMLADRVNERKLRRSECERLEEWIFAPEGKGLRISRSKILIIVYDLEGN